MRIHPKGNKRINGDCARRCLLNGSGTDLPRSGPWGRLVEPTMAFRRKGSLRAEARRCLRGVLIPPIDVHSSPTAYRSSIRLLLSLGCAPGLQFLCLEASQACANAEPADACGTSKDRAPVLSRIVMGWRD